MNSPVNEILNQKWVSIDVTFETINALKASVPRKPGLYSILTNTTKEELRQFGQRDDKMHYNLKKKVEATDVILTEFKINQTGDDLYCVYNGHTQSLRQRLSEHFLGSRGTACLALFNLESLRNYSWRFEYLDLSSTEKYMDSKVFRTILEQHLRVMTGWPILCGQ